MPDQRWIDEAKKLVSNWESTGDSVRFHYEYTRDVAQLAQEAWEAGVKAGQSTQRGDPLKFRFDV